MSEAMNRESRLEKIGIALGILSILFQVPGLILIYLTSYGDPGSNHWSEPRLQPILLLSLIGFLFGLSTFPVSGLILLRGRLGIRPLICVGTTILVAVIMVVDAHRR